MSELTEQIIQFTCGLIIAYVFLRLCYFDWRKK